MKILLRESKEFLVNSLAEFILFKIPISEKTIIQIVDCENFYVVKGKTTSKEVLDLNKIKDEFLEKNPDLKNEKKLLNTIDLIDYGVELKPVKIYCGAFFSAENCSIEKNKILENENLIISSNFPYGYSLDMGRILYFFAKNLVYNIPPNFIFEKILVSVEANDEEFNFSFKNEYNENEESLNSLFLDCVNTNIEKFRKDLLKSNWQEEVNFTEKDLDFLKTKIKGLILV